MPAIDFDLIMAHAGRAVAADVLQRTVTLGGLPGKHHFYLTFDTRFAGVEIPAYLKERHGDELTIVLQDRFWDLAVSDDGFTVSLSFDNKPETIVVPFLALTTFNDPSVPFDLTLAPIDQRESAAAARSLTVARAMLSVLKPDRRIDYVAAMDRVGRAAALCAVRMLRDPDAGEPGQELLIDVDAHFAGLVVPGGTAPSDATARYRLEIDDSTVCNADSTQVLRIGGSAGAAVVPIGAMRAITLLRNGERATFDLGEPSPDFFERAPVDSIVSHVAMNAEKAARAVVLHALEKTSLLGQLPTNHHFYISFATHFPGVDLPDRIAERYPDTLTIILQWHFSELACEEDAFSVTVGFGGQDERIRVPYLAITGFQDPAVSYDRTYPPIDPTVATEERPLFDAARAQLGPATSTDSLDYLHAEARTARVAIAMVMSALAEGRVLNPLECLEFVVDPTSDGLDIPDALRNPFADELTLLLDHQATTPYATPAAIGWRSLADNLLRIVPFNALKQVRVASANDEITLKFPPAGLTAALAPAPEQPAPGSRMINRFVATSGHLIHKLKAKDSTGRWAYYFVLVMPSSEREFLDALGGPGTIDIEDYGKVVASCYGEEPSQVVRDYLFERYGFNV